MKSERAVVIGYSRAIHIKTGVIHRLLTGFPTNLSYIWLIAIFFQQNLRSFFRLYHHKIPYATKEVKFFGVMRLLYKLQMSIG